MPDLYVSELFGPVHQGEGRNVGRSCSFLRLAGCNLSCAWCDTPYTWDWKRFHKRSESRPMTTEQVMLSLQGHGTRALVITGGEPMLQQQRLQPLTERLHENGWWTEIETAGTVLPLTRGLVQQWTVSVKLASSGLQHEQRIRPDVLRTFETLGAVWKFVVADETDLAEAEELVAAYKMRDVYLMPQGKTPETVLAGLQWLGPVAASRGYHLSPRLHVLVHGDRRGV